MDKTEELLKRFAFKRPTEIKPCPFCGEKAEISQLPEVPDEIKSGMWVVGCDGVKGSLCPGYKYKLNPFYTTKETAIEMWNSRN